jgi:hypothetical protein
MIRQVRGHEFRYRADAEKGTTSAASDHRLCDEMSPTGCPRCAPQFALHCCDLCDPQHFSSLHIPTTGTNDDSGSPAVESEDEPMNDDVKIRKSRVKPLKLTDEVVGSRDALYTW